MGWTFTYGADRAKIIAQRTAETEYSKTLRKALVGNVLWTVREMKREQEGLEKIWIGCDLLDKMKDGVDANGKTQYAWGYKDMCESMGPAQVSCPLAFLELAPQPKGEYAAGWRDEVRAYHARRKALAAVKPGDILLAAGCTIKCFEVVSAKPLRGKGSDGRLYRIPQKYVTKIQRRLPGKPEESFYETAWEKKAEKPAQVFTKEVR